MKKSKINYLLLSFGLLLFSCQPAADNGSSGNAGLELFEKNSATVRTVLNGFANENLDHRNYYAEDFQSWPTTYGATDTLSLDQVIAQDQGNWARYDFEMVNGPYNLLPGVDVETKMPDGSVRYYGVWRASRAATDSSEAKSGLLPIYSAFVFNEEGKITLQLTYGDFTGIVSDLNRP